MAGMELYDMEVEAKCRHFGGDMFQCIFLNICFRYLYRFVANWQQVSIVSGNVLASNRREAINRSNDGLVNLRKMESFVFDEFNSLRPSDAYMR